MEEAYHFNSKIDTIARGCALIGIFLTPISTTMSNLLIVAAVFNLFGGKIRAKLKLLLDLRMTYIAALMLLNFFIGIFYNPYSISMGLVTLYKISLRLIIIFFLIPLFIEKKWRDYAINTILASAAILSLLIILVYSDFTRNFFPNHLYWAKVIQVYTNGLLLAFSAYLTVYRLFRRQGSRLLCLGVYLLVTYALLFINTERTGIVIYFCLIGLALWQSLRVHKILTSLILIAILSALAFGFYHLSPTLRATVRRTYVHINNITNGGTSIGKRYLLAKYSLELIKKRPLFGYGTGLFNGRMPKNGMKIIENTSTPDKGMHGRTSTAESVYLIIALQIGLVGLTIFMLWIGIQFYETYFLLETEKQLAQALIITMLISFLVIPSFFMNHSSFFYCSTLAVLFASRFQQAVL